MKTSKWHALNYIVDVLRQLESIKYLDAGIFEISHRIYKEKYGRESRRKQTVMDKVLTKDLIFDRLKPISRSKKTEKSETVPV